METAGLLRPSIFSASSAARLIRGSRKRSQELEKRTSFAAGHQNLHHAMPRPFSCRDCSEMRFPPTKDALIREGGLNGTVTGGRTTVASSHVKLVVSVKIGGRAGDDKGVGLKFDAAGYR